MTTYAMNAIYAAYGFSGRAQYCAGISWGSPARSGGAWPDKWRGKSTLHPA